jgi:hypothetical protein
MARALQSRGDGESNGEPSDGPAAVPRDGKWIAFSGERASGDGISVARRGAEARATHEESERAPLFRRPARKCRSRFGAFVFVT